MTCCGNLVDTATRYIEKGVRWQGEREGALEVGEVDGGEGEGDGEREVGRS